MGETHQNAISNSRKGLLIQGRKFVILTRSPFCTVETDRASLSCIVMQRAKNDSDAFFMFTLVFPCLFAFFASERV
ncbi:TPA_asm: hypothetical protein G3X05_004856 [Salmonella enterica subsp. enterica serovar Typhimurium]|uniref:Uncharacterized protein n=1 Tax=Salmonella typhimurium TaxID=90371 RepID=A0A736XI37_SALTM|nr:hypothetical protein [Salmonella enterica subsp. enterica serovar Typhimurium]HAE2131774.1 hypothetical protein [Salmonella enterica subsp. enterica serovar Typhimurium]HAE4794723.1 hypothetical protein [Salmonella enterica subsp. enterica serovar Typhimurium]HAE7933336.1 hypothetical protein [Salmonella enterica subsp. enterica serovar Typhimurium]HAE8654599.1 hypothetical protein [Salmonella enterica subsp. enterica serovar Typhimurium]